MEGVEFPSFWFYSVAGRSRWAGSCWKRSRSCACAEGTETHADLGQPNRAGTSLGLDHDSGTDSGPAITRRRPCEPRSPLRNRASTSGQRHDRPSTSTQRPCRQAQSATIQLSSIRSRGGRGATSIAGGGPARSAADERGEAGSPGALGTGRVADRDRRPGRHAGSGAEAPPSDAGGTADPASPRGDRGRAEVAERAADSTWREPRGPTARASGRTVRQIGLLQRGNPGFPALSASWAGFHDRSRPWPRSSIDVDAETNECRPDTASDEREIYRSY